jgi:enoyl-CoA hydratase/carnithine racemase
MNDEIIYTKEDGVAIFKINRPEAMNAICPNTMQKLHDSIIDFSQDSSLLVGIITGIGDRAFCAGADIKLWLPFAEQCKSQPWLMPTSLMRGLDVEKPLIAAVNGMALGGGFELALACDIRVASTNARFGFPEANLGIMPRWGGTQRLPRLISRAKATEILLTGKIIDADEALRIDLISDLVTAEQLLPTARSLARKICSLAPLAVRAVKEAINRGIDLPLDQALWLENTLASPLYDTKDYLEGRTAFKEKRRPAFRGE